VPQDEAGEASEQVWDPAAGTLILAGLLGAGADARPVTATLLPSGRALVIDEGGSAQVWDPATDSSAPTGSLDVSDSPPFGDPLSATLLPDGRVLVLNGEHSAQVRDADTGLFVPTGSRLEARSGGTATLLSDGRVLVAGGEGPCVPSTTGLKGACRVVMLASAELWDPATGVFSATGRLTTERWNHAVTLLSDGRVFSVGGQTNQGTAEVFELK
jgi:hypothetical protein